MVRSYLVCRLPRRGRRGTTVDSGRGSTAAAGIAATRSQLQHNRRIHIVQKQPRSKLYCVLHHLQANRKIFHNLPYNFHWLLITGTHRFSPELFQIYIGDCGEVDPSYCWSIWSTPPTKRRSRPSERQREESRQARGPSLERTSMSCTIYVLALWLLKCKDL